MQLSTALRYADDPRATIAQAVELEKQGLDAVWIAEAYGFDSPTLLGALAASTERVLVGTGVLNVYSRTPALIAQTAAGLDAVSGGRAILGLGASGPQVVEGWHGVPYDRPVARTREVVDICRTAWRRDTVEHHGGVYQLPLASERGTGLGKPLKMLTRPVRERIPVYLAALGERNVALAAEVADGWLPYLYYPEKAKEIWGDALADGQRRRSPDLEPLQLVAGGILAIGEDRAAMRDLARPMTALYVGGMGAKGKNFYNALVRRYGFEAEAERIQDLYLSGRRSAAEAAVPDELIDHIHLVGPADHVLQRIAAYHEAGVTMLNVVPAGPDPLASVALVRAATR
ncbi:LLM class F420-dependent oxidoreductase [Yinghuangia sp. YIM S09857]|uniref:LLM class F420-dependent oxidoreductase n=1 Tax=Yinghuangia sp. YIM S09857 TaxID=3436929 RepID=UPI003F531838